VYCLEKEEQDLAQKMQAPRGTRDYFGAPKLLRDSVSSILKTAFEKYCFEPLETPAFENLDVLSAKFAGGEEILKETYAFADQGGRKLGLRYDFTVPLARFFASNPNMAKPFKRYALGSVWRDGPLKTGRWREFVQCDVDIVGVAGIEADAEILALTCEALCSLCLPFKVRVNNRKLLQAVLEKAGIPVQNELSVILSLDKLDKIGWQGVEKEFLGKGVASPAQIESLKSLLLSGKEGLFKALAGSQGLQEIEQLLAFANEMGFGQQVELSPTLARGLNYYTGNVFEAFLLNGEQLGLTSSLAGGGRYDNLVGGFLQKSSGRNETVCAVGISFGLDVLCEAIARCGKEKELTQSKSQQKAFVIPVGGEREAFAVVQRLRREGARAAIDLIGRGLGKNVEYASKQGYGYAVFVGKAETSIGKVKIKNLKSGEEKTVGISEAAAIIRGS